MKRIVCIICAAVFALTARAEIRLPAFFDDGMVLQQQATVRIWGTAAAGAKVTLTAGWDNRTYTCKAASNGSWALKVRRPLRAGPMKSVSATARRSYCATFSSAKCGYVPDSPIWKCL